VTNLSTGEPTPTASGSDGGAASTTTEGGAVDGGADVDADAAFTTNCSATGRPPHTIGVVKLGNGEVQLADDNGGLSTRKTFLLGAVPGTSSVFAGQWSGTAGATVGYFYGTTQSFHLFDQNMEPSAEKFFSVGDPNDIGFAGDFDGNGITTVGVYKPSAGELQYFLATNPAQGDTATADSSVRFGDPGGLPLIGDWNCDGRDDFGVFYQATGRFRLRLGPAVGQELDFTVGKTGSDLYPIAGDWDGDGTVTIGLFDNSARKFFLAKKNEANPEWLGGTIGTTYPPTSGDYRPIAARFKP